MYCAQREHLLAAYENAVRAYKAAVSGLSGQQGAQFAQANHALDRILATVEKARERVDIHQREHRCGFDGTHLP